MAEQEDQALDEMTEAEKVEIAEEISPKAIRRRSIYIVKKEFTHKRKQKVGSVFRPRRYPRLRPRKLRDLVAGGFIRLANMEELIALKTPPGTRINPSSKAYSPPKEEVVESSIEHIGGGWYEVTVDGETQKVQGEEAAAVLLEEMIDTSNSRMNDKGD